ncbi:GGDEF domain-containing protein [Anaeromicropila herbilytica]|uniref:GGDEF domain-containing protein n=1 Tax=Anaeromicropila herbilytica TaxID=2785025 RepID=A0A7R7IAV8_9FIRM|nr:GGDEF domain-containing protein [Anaeromicropila herbilytica]BCN28878.1 GGDEF domain-containing protein [Anaeromicropila herbilytica]
MDIYLRIDIDLMAMFFLGAILFIAYKSLDMQDIINKAYMIVSFIVMLELLFEASSCVINGNTGELSRYISYILHIFLFTTAPILSMSGYYLIRFVVMSDYIINKKKAILLGLPVFISMGFTLLSLKYNYIFYLDADNIYHRGDFFIAFSIITYFYFLLDMIVIIRYRKLFIQQELISLILFILLPTIGGVIQTLFYGPLLMWSATALALVIIYVFLQQSMVHLDDLTGTWTRGSFEYYMNKRLKYHLKKQFGLIYCDLDNFKSINDGYGHYEGDRAIMTATQIIKNSLRKNDIIARMGGDEFVMLVECDSIQRLDDIVVRMKQKFNTYNKVSGKDYRLDCSFGADMLDLSQGTTEQMLHHVDCLMYENKRSKKK